MSETSETQLYVSPGHYLLIYETEQHASISKAHVSGRRLENLAVQAQNYLSKELKSKIFLSKPGDPIFVLQKNGIFWNVIIGERIGWIIVRNWLEIKPLKRLTENEV